MDLTSVFLQSNSEEISDRVEYAVFPDFSLSSTESCGKAENESLEQLRVACLDIVWPFTENYVWQKESFILRQSLTQPACRSKKSKNINTGASPTFWCPIPENMGDTEVALDIPHLYGSTRVGDCIEDEWFITFLLLEVSKRLPRVSIGVRDSDGEFLLMEAAYAIPHWLKPDTSTNRVFLRQGCLHIIPRSLASDTPSLRSALQLLIERQLSTLATDKVQQAVRLRLDRYPEKARDNMHFARCRVPIGVAQILKHEPQMVSLAVDAFYTRDLDSLSSAASLSFFFPRPSLLPSPHPPPPSPPLVEILVRFNKAMYAQLKLQTFHPPKHFPLPLPSEESFSAAELGMKLTVGFEIAYQEGEGVRAGAGRSGNDGIDGGGSTGWEGFRKVLERLGYFQGLPEGSKGWAELERRGRERYERTETFERMRAAMVDPVARIHEILALSHSVADFPPTNLGRSDDDSWLYDGQEDFEREMAKRQSEVESYEARKAAKVKEKAGKAVSKDGGEEDEEEFDPSDVIHGMRAFMEKLSGLEGVEVPGGEEKKVDGVSLDMQRFMEELEKVAGFHSGGKKSRSSGGNLSESETESDSDLDWDIVSEEEDEGEEGEDEEFKIEEPIKENRQSSSNVSTMGYSRRLRNRATLQEVSSDSDAWSIPREMESSSKTEEDLGSSGTDDEDFDEEYTAAMEEELGGTTLCQSFERAVDPAEKTSRGEEGNVDASQKNAKTTADEESTKGKAAGLQPIDVDMNLVKSLLESYSSQQGLPGPASNLLGIMGLQLPDGKKHSRK